MKENDRSIMALLRKTAYLYTEDAISPLDKQ